MSAELDALTAQVAATVSAEQAAAQLLQGLHDQLLAAIAANNSGDTTALPQLAADLKAQTDALAAAVTANTPADAGSTVPSAAA